MAKPTILAVDDDEAVSRAIVRDLRAHYGADYRILRATSGDEALALMKELALKARPLALVVSDQRMPGLTGIELLGRVRELSPGTKLLLLTAYADSEVAITAINEIGLDYYMFKPWDPPEERLYPVVDDLLGDWAGENPDHEADVRVVGHLWSDASHDVKMFLTRNHVPYRWLDVERDSEARQLMDVADASADALPLVLMADGTALLAPTPVALAEALGLRTQAEQPLYDLCIVGSGPAGLAAAVYAASEGLRTVVVERDAPGGQAGQSAAIENYLGFPKGLSGADLTHRAVAQARRFGAETVLAREVTGLETRGPVRAVLLDGGGQIEARAVVIATGVSYRRLEATGLEELGTRGVSYGATASEAAQCQDEDVYVVGAANSAGQAVLNFARYARRVVMVVRAADLERSMSEYLIHRIRANPTIEVRFCTEVVGARGDGHLEGLTLADRSTGEEYDVETHRLFVFIGASPRTDWLGDAVSRDAKGFVVTGPDLALTDQTGTDLALTDQTGTDQARTDQARTDQARTDRGRPWAGGRAPYALETSVPGVFAAGDVRLDSMKRVASAVGEGAMAVYLIHRYLETV